ncbi:hypothetical protein, partial [Aphanizomenon sp. UHCC 0183]|uniref:hypothetical protein n=1 Tax=Aphanizomenon sp. UHCC 0183 TaxID=2590028 RepID=UPI001C2CA6BD
NISLILAKELNLLSKFPSNKELGKSLTQINTSQSDKPLAILISNVFVIIYNYLVSLIQTIQATNQGFIEFS